MLRFLTAGESHGQALVITLDGMPAGLQLDIDALNAQLRRRQGGYGRGRRMQIESDRAEILAGVRHGRTTGAPIALLIRNRDWVNWQQTMYVERGDAGGRQRRAGARTSRGRGPATPTSPAPSSTATTTSATCSSAPARAKPPRASLPAASRASSSAHSASDIASHVSAIGDVVLRRGSRSCRSTEAQALPDDAPLRCVDAELQQRMMADIDAAREAGDTVGGAFEVIATGVPPGLGSYVQWDRKLDGRLGQAMMCIHAIKAVGIGIGPEVAIRPGSRVHDEILPPAARRSAPRVRPTNNAGGLEGGVTNGEDVRVTGFMKPIATLMKPLRSVDLNTMTEAPAAIERSDVCAVPGRGRRRRGDGGVRAGRRVPREVRRRLDRRDRAALRRDRRAGPPPLRGRATATRAEPADDPADPPLRRRRPAPPAAPVGEITPDDPAAHRRHDPDDVRRAGHRAGGHAGRRRRCGSSSADVSVGRNSGRSADVHQPGVRRARRHAARRGRLPERARVQRHGGAAVARGGQGARPRRPASRSSRAPACWRAASSTRWITSTARCSSIACAGCRRI